jgi:hypothetical protein
MRAVCVISEEEEEKRTYCNECKSIRVSWRERDTNLGDTSVDLSGWPNSKMEFQRRKCLFFFGWATYDWDWPFTLARIVLNPFLKKSGWKRPFSFPTGWETLANYESLLFMLPSWYPTILRSIARLIGVKKGYDSLSSNIDLQRDARVSGLDPVSRRGASWNEEISGFYSIIHPSPHLSTWIETHFPRRVRDEFGL